MRKFYIIAAFLLTSCSKDKGNAPECPCAFYQNGIRYENIKAVNVHNERVRVTPCDLDGVSASYTNGYEVECN